MVALGPRWVNNTSSPRSPRLDQNRRECTSAKRVLGMKRNICRDVCSICVSGIVKVFTFDRQEQTDAGPNPVVLIEHHFLFLSFSVASSVSQSSKSGCSVHGTLFFVFGKPLIITHSKMLHCADKK